MNSRTWRSPPISPAAWPTPASGSKPRRGASTDFIPLVRERYFFAIRKTALESAAMRALLEGMRSPEYRGFVGQLPGYDASDTGAIQTLEQAFARDFRPRAAL